VSNGCCVECSEAKTKDWRAANTDKVREQQKSWYDANRNHSLDYRKRWYEANRETALLYSSEYRSANREAVLARNKAWREANQDKVKENSHRRRARELAAEGTWTAADIDTIRLLQKGRCPVCGADLRKTGEHIDHVEPLSKGGSNWPENLQLLCPHCNLTKSDKDPIDFMNERGFLL